MVGYTQFFDMGFLGSTLSLLIHVEKNGPDSHPQSPFLYPQDTNGAIMPDTKITNQLKPSTNKYMGLCIYIYTYNHKYITIYIIIYTHYIMVYMIYIYNYIYKTAINWRWQLLQQHKQWNTHWWVWSLTPKAKALKPTNGWATCRAVPGRLTCVGRIMIGGWYLVGGFNHLEKYEFVNGKDDIPYITVWEKKHVPNHQPDIITSTCPLPHHKSSVRQPHNKPQAAPVHHLHKFIQWNLQGHWSLKRQPHWGIINKFLGTTPISE